jgi:hypothetical protein
MWVTLGSLLLVFAVASILICSINPFLRTPIEGMAKQYVVVDHTNIIYVRCSTSIPIAHLIVINKWFEVASSSTHDPFMS